jgi:hypothetical protein
MREVNGRTASGRTLVVEEAPGGFAVWIDGEQAKITNVGTLRDGGTQVMRTTRGEVEFRNRLNSSTEGGRDRRVLLDGEEVEQAVSASTTAILRALIDHALITHPLPWRVEHDWTCEVRASDDAYIAKCRDGETARAIVELAERVSAEHEEARSRLPKDVLRNLGPGPGRDG